MCLCMFSPAQIVYIYNYMQPPFIIVGHAVAAIIIKGIIIDPKGGEGM